MTSAKSRWTTIPQDASIIRATAKAVLLNFGFRGYGLQEREAWVPKSCYREIDEGAFHHRQIKTWIVTKNDLWDAMG